MKFYGYIYLIKDLKHNKVYVGRKNGDPNKSKNYYGSGAIIKNIIKSRGTYFLQKIVLGCCDSFDELKKCEEECIQFYNSHNPIYGYNLIINNNGKTGYKCSEETKKKISISNLGKIISHEARQKISNAHKGKKLSYEHKKNIGVSILGKNKGKKRSIEVKNKMSIMRRGKNIGKLNPYYGKKHSPEIREKISKNQSGNKNHNYGKPRSEETKKKISESCKKSKQKNKEI